MVARSRYRLFAFTGAAHFLRNQYSSGTICLFLVLMKNFFSKYKKNILQLAGLSVAFIVTGNVLFIYLVLFFLITMLVLPAVYQRITHFIDNVINAAGIAIKTVVLTFMFLLIIVPVSFIRKIFTKKDDSLPGETFFITRNKTMTASDLEKMW
jgi:hypothetical protein